MRGKSWLLIIVVALTTLGIRSDEADALAVMLWPPESYSGYLTYIENGEFDPTAPNPDGVPGCFQQVCSGDYFHTEVMGRTLAEVSALEAEAKQFFLGSFGVDVDDPANMGKIFFRRYYRDPRINLRAYVVSGTIVPNEGWEVHEGGWSLVFLEDYTLGGEHAGEVAPAGTSLKWGEQKIEVTRGHGRWRRVVGEIVVAQRSGVVAATAPNGILICHCETFAGRIEDAGGGWGDFEFPHEGLNEMIITAPTAGADPDTIRVNGRHTLTFSALGGL